MEREDHIVADNPTSADPNTSAAVDLDLDALLEPPMRDALTALAGRASLLDGMARYHLGYADADLYELPAGTVDRGKRVRPAIALLVAGAMGGKPERAASIAAALELLHNFTLIHDDIQDESRTRRHRPTVWALWGVGQAINAGDALYAAAHLPFYQLPAQGISLELSLRLLEEFDRMAIAIVAGQSLDLSFEKRSDVSPSEYLAMIAGKTAAIVRYAAWAGALAGDASEARAREWGEFGLALGLGFQIRDDLLGTWGTPDQTGKANGDDIRRRKQTLPALLLRERLDEEEREELDRLYASPRFDDAGVACVLTMLERKAVRREVEIEIAKRHDQALRALEHAAPPGDNPYHRQLRRLVEQLASRSR